ncbi:hypothetical protein ABIC22_001941 [Paenibacillus sp. PvP094]
MKYVKPSINKSQGMIASASCICGLLVGGGG